MHAVSHAGEHGPAWEVRHAVEQFGAERVQHGIGAMQDPEVVKLLVDNGIVVAEEIGKRLFQGEERLEAATNTGRSLAMPLCWTGWQWN